MTQAANQLMLFDIGDSVESNVVEEAPTMSLLDKFTSIDITVEQRINELETDYCKKQEVIFYESRDLLKKFLDEMQALCEKYSEKDDYRDMDVSLLNKYDDLEKVKSRITTIYRQFISRITGFFVRRYHVTLSSSDIECKYDENSISYSVILDEIFEQLGGLSFKEKAIEEIKAASRKGVYNKSKIQITKNKLSISDYIFWDTSIVDNSKSVRYDDRQVRPLLLALSHFTTDSVDLANCLSQIYQELYRGSRDYDIFSKYEIGINNLDSLKMFKNGKIEIVFNDHENAEAFKNEYLI